jgi:D-aminopeptidase
LIQLQLRALLAAGAMLALTGAALAQERPQERAQERPQARPRARELGVAPGILAPGPLNAITDVEGVAVGQVTLVEGERVRSGVTVVVPHPGNVYQDKVPAAVHVGNGFGKLMGVTQIRELGEIETPIALTCTLCVPNAANALISYTLAQPGNEEVRSVNAVVGETNDGGLNDIRARPVREEHVLAALREARAGPVAEGAVGAGTGTIAFGWKGGIGTSSRRTPERLGGHTVGVLVQSNFGGILQVLGAPVGQELGRYYLQDETAGTQNGIPEAAVSRAGGEAPGEAFPTGGSIMIVIATDAPLDPASLERLAKRAMLAVGRVGSPMTSGSGDYAIAFSSAPSVRHTPARRSGAVMPVATVPADRLSPLFEAVVEATEEAIYNSLFKAVTTSGNGLTVEALPLDKVVEILRRHRFVP